MNQVGVLKKRSKHRQYDPPLLEEAAGLVRSKTMSLSKAAKEFGVPKTTLHDKVQFKYESDRVGAKPILSDSEELRIAEWALHMAKIGFGRTRQELTTVVKKILDEQGRITKFKDNRPGRDWLRAFFKRHPSLTLRSTLQLGKERAIISEEKVQKLFDSVNDYVNNELKDPDLLKDPSRLYNADESGFSLSLKNSQVIGPKAAPVVYNFGNSDKTQLTIMAAVSAVGHYIPPMLVFPGQRFSYNPLEGFEEAVLGRSDSGWMDTELFCQWLETVFIPAINERSVKRPVLLFIDGHSTHVILEASDICVRNQIEMFCLLEHASHVLQPLDLKFFRCLKQSWKQSVRDWQSENVGQFVTKKTFAKVFRGAWEKSTTIEAAVKGFQESGLFPLNPSAVTKSVKLAPSNVFACNEKGDGESKTNGDETQQQDRCGTEQRKEDETAESTDGSAEPENIQEPPCVQATPVKQLQTNSSLSTTPALSPLSKHLQYPKAGASQPKKKNFKVPKAITGKDYRDLLTEKKLQKENEEKAKTERKEQRILKIKEREEEKELKQREKLVKMRIKEAEKEKKDKKKQEKLEKALKDVVDSDSDDEVMVSPGNCYACEKPYDNFLMCTKCCRKFHPECVADELLDGVDLELDFECKYC